MQSPQPQASGFSLIELSIVMAIMSMMATAIVPGMISQQRGKLVEATVETYYGLGDAAMAYYIDNEFWPGFMDADNSCQVDGLGQSALKVLADEGYISNERVHNPWQDGVLQFFTLQAVGIPTGCAGDCESCALTIKSDQIPVSAHNVLANLLPLAACDGPSLVCSMQMSEDAGAGGSGAAMPSGAIIMSDEVCPDGFELVNELAGRFPVGAGHNGATHSETYELKAKGGVSGFSLFGGGAGGVRGYVKSQNNGHSTAWGTTVGSFAIEGFSGLSQTYQGYAFTRMGLKQEIYDGNSWNKDNQVTVGGTQFNGKDDLYFGSSDTDALVATSLAEDYKTDYLQINPPNYALYFCRKL
jgi:prepilin-type N-terminal cleavage/methylation domain-containing protein